MSSLADMHNEMVDIVNGWRRNLTTIDQSVIDEAAAEMAKDPHEHSTRPCGTCQRITAMLGKPFWCSRVATEAKARYVVFWLFSEFIVQTRERPPAALFDDDNIHIVRITDGRIEEWQTEDKFWFDMDSDFEMIRRAAEQDAEDQINNQGRAE